MSVYTPVSQTELESHLESYEIGQLVEFEGISAGVENTNYFVTTTKGEFVLTLVESVEECKLPFIFGLVDQLTEQGIRCAKLIRDCQGSAFRTLNQRPAVIMQRLAGKPVSRPTHAQALTIGETLARAHLASSTMPQEHYTHIQQWCLELGAKVQPHLASKERDLLQTALMRSGELPWQRLPSGPIHADLFPDNAMFDGNSLTGIIDFYHACSAPYLYDLAVTLNAWSWDEATLQYDEQIHQNILSQYQNARLLNSDELFYLPLMQLAAATRFWLSRLRDLHFPADGEQITVKNPAVKQSLVNHHLSGYGRTAAV